MTADPTAGGDPATLNRSGDTFRDGANALGRVQNAFYDGGENAKRAMKANDFGDQHGVPESLEALARKFYGLLWSANFELQNGALNFWQQAQDFATADRPVEAPYGTTRREVKDSPNGVKYEYVVDSKYGPGGKRVVAVEDHEGNLVELHVDGEGVNEAPEIERPEPPSVPLPAQPEPPVVPR